MQIWISPQPEPLTLSTLSRIVLSCLVAAVREVRYFLFPSSKLDSVTVVLTNILSSCVSPNMVKQKGDNLCPFSTTKGIEFNTKLLNQPHCTALLCSILVPITYLGGFACNLKPSNHYMFHFGRYCWEVSSCQLSQFLG